MILKQGKEKALLRGHPWVFSGAVDRVEGEISPGDLGEVYSKEGAFLGTGHLNLHSQIVCRLLTRKKEGSETGLLRERISKAVLLREKWFGGTTDAYRMVNGEGDLLPGLIIDRYAGVFVLQVLTAGMERLKNDLIGFLAEDFPPVSIYERSDASTRKEEGLPESSGLLFGKEIAAPVDIQEHHCRFRVDVVKGQKTGFYLDQRENRLLLGGHCEGKSILDCFSYTGAFSVYAGSARARELTLIDSSEESLAMAKVHLHLNGLEHLQPQLIRGDAFEAMRELKPGYDIVILDPPPFARKKGSVPRASRGYKDLNLQALRLLGREGLLLTFSCSHHIGLDLFQKIVFAAAVDAGKKVQCLGRMGQPADHPFNLSHPEGEYLKGLLCRVL